MYTREEYNELQRTLDVLRKKKDAVQLDIEGVLAKMRKMKRAGISEHAVSYHPTRADEDADLPSITPSDAVPDFLKRKA